MTSCYIDDRDVIIHDADIKIHDIDVKFHDTDVKILSADIKIGTVDVKIPTVTTIAVTLQRITRAKSWETIHIVFDAETRGIDLPSPIVMNGTDTDMCLLSASSACSEFNGKMKETNEPVSSSRNYTPSIC